MKDLECEKSFYLYAGSWDHVVGEPGIDLYSFDVLSGRAEFIRTLNSDLACGNTLLDEKRGILYIANEVDHLSGRHGGGGRVVGYQIDHKTGDLRELCDAPTFCANPSYIALDPAHRFMVVSNHSGSGAVTTVEQDSQGNYYANVIYDDATVNLYAVNDDGSIGRLMDIRKHYGAGIRKKQFHPHPHSAVRSPLWNLYAVCDKGNDGIYFYRLDEERGKLELCPDMPYHDIAGSMPRYGVFHPKRPLFFCNHEGERLVHSFTYDQQGKLRLEDSVDILPEEYQGAPGTHYEQQDMKISPSGECLYTLVHGRGTDAVCVVGIDGTGGRLELLQVFSLEGKWPRCCTLSPDGRFLLVGCMISGTMEVCEIRPDGRLKQGPVCSMKQGLACLALVNRS